MGYRIAWYDKEGWHTSTGKKIGGALTPQNVVKKYAPLVGGPVNARQIIALGLREGTLRARAGKRWTSTDASLVLGWKNEPDKGDYVKPASFSKEHDIKSIEWNKSVDFLNDILTWDFRKGRIHITTSVQPTKRIMMRHVRFLDEDVKSIFQFATEGAKSNFYRANKVNEWRRFWHEMLIIAAQGKLNLKNNLITTFTNADDIIATVLERLELERIAVNEAEDGSIDGLGKKIGPRLEFPLSADTLQKEVDELRTTLGLKRKYSSKNRSLGLDRVVRTGTAGSAK